MLFIVNLNRAPRILTTSHSSTVGRFDLRVGTDDGERNLSSNLFVLGERLFVVSVVDRRLEDLNAMVRDIVENLRDSVMLEAT